MKKINVGLIGFGNVGCGVVKILRDRRRLLAEKIGSEIIVRKICDKDISAKRSVSVPRDMLTSNVSDIVNDPQIDIVVELMGGINPAKEFISLALKKGKNIVTANKALLAHHGRELFALAKDCAKCIYFEAAVGAGIPIIKSVREGLVANRFSSVLGIVNGTSNFILSSMSGNNCSFAEALKDAQRKGFAEKDPTLDIEGMDSAHKLVLLAYLCFGRMVSMDEIFIEGISHISLSDINYAKELGFEIKLLAIAKKDEDELEVRVHPTLIPQEHLLASVDGVNNAIAVGSDLAGDLLFYGPGAGQSSAASGVVSDLVDLTQGIKAGLFRPVLNVAADGSIHRLSKIDEIDSRYYIRFMALDKPGVLARIAGILAKSNISIASVSQKAHRRAKAVPIVMVIHEAKERNLREALRIIDKMNIIHEKSVAIRIEDV
ncbi:MAG TPA: homoserine dehydrogenase [Candidatus Omnitrophota bacterium]|nr:homoserine dehydrogenase [Candidatus Omnitrophota bacterium]HNQ50345.1 homoserine dehydrogenase [Candidatus Omnitrophota bacterium]HQO38766.1 homoserine dehydrogenase [Candidatus Omnitrophota bacterium]